MHYITSNKAQTNSFLNSKKIKEYKNIKKNFKPEYNSKNERKNFILNNKFNILNNNNNTSSPNIIINPENKMQNKINSNIINVKEKEINNNKINANKNSIQDINIKTLKIKIKKKKTIKKWIVII